MQRKTAGAVETQPTCLILPPETFDAFAAALENPAEPNERLKAMGRAVTLTWRQSDVLELVRFLGEVYVPVGVNDKRWRCWPGGDSAHLNSRTMTALIEREALASRDPADLPGVPISVVARCPKTGGNVWVVWSTRGAAQ